MLDIILLAIIWLLCWWRVVDLWEWAGFKKREKIVLYPMFLLAAPLMLVISVLCEWMDE